MIFVSIEALEAIHKDWKAGVNIRGIKTRSKKIDIENLVPKEVTGAIIELNSKMKKKGINAVKPRNILPAVKENGPI